MLRGSSSARLDEKGRLKIPTLFRRYIEDTYGREFFVTSHNGEYVRLYPMPVWIEMEKRLAAGASMNPPMHRFRTVVNYYGQTAGMDDQGRVLIHPRLRESSGVADGEVTVIGNLTYLDVWNHEKFRSSLVHPTDEDLASLSI